MLRTMCKSKIHKATVTESELYYEGSLTLDTILMDAADMKPFEKVQVVRNLDESNTPLDQPAAEQTTLAKLTTKSLAQCGRFVVQREGALERGAAEFQTLCDRIVVVAEP